MRSKWINRVLSVALLFTTLTTSVSYTFTTAYAEEAGASTQQSAPQMTERSLFLKIRL